MGAAKRLSTLKLKTTKGFKTTKKLSSAKLSSKGF